ncbi:MAG: cellulase family glycosylhydrolase [Bacteroidota bacterium]
MKRFIRILLVFLFALLLLALGGYWYIQRAPAWEKIDTRSFESASSQALKKVRSPQLPQREGKNIQAAGKWFKDRTGRKMLLRGLNVGGNTKNPFQPYMPSDQSAGFFEGKTVSFVGRPFPLEEADEHLRRIKKWGFHFIRFLVTWEAIEHEGPGIYDEEYLEYIYQVLQKAGEMGINAFIDPHQDVWSRYSGGSGAPKWTFEVVGLAPEKFKASGAAIVHNTEGDPFPRMIWPTNYEKLAAATMFTLFFGGNDFAPGVMIDSISVQDYLQDHFVNALKEVAYKVRDLPNVIGFETMNEPKLGYIGKRLDELPLLKNGLVPSYFQTMAAGAGYPQEVDLWSVGTGGFENKGLQTLNPEGVSAWKSTGEPIWKKQGIWGLDKEGQPELLKNDYFLADNPNQSYFKPFVEKYAAAIREVDPAFLIFIEPPLLSRMPKWEAIETEGFVNATHWYDVISLLTKNYYSFFTMDIKKEEMVIGRRAVHDHFREVMQTIKEETEETLGERPTLIGEFGTPFDLANKAAYQSGNFSDQEAVLNRSFRAIEENLLHYALWTYVEDNSNEKGDHWNGEDLSIFSEDQRENRNDINSGGRALSAVIRPYPYKVCGEPRLMQFNTDKVRFSFQYEAKPVGDFPTEIFIPDYHFGEGFTVYFSSGRVAFNKEEQLLYHYPEGSGEVSIVVERE